MLQPLLLTCFSFSWKLKIDFLVLYSLDAGFCGQSSIQADVYVLVQYLTLDIKLGRYDCFRRDISFYIDLSKMEDRYLSNNKDEKRYKIIIVGDSNVGKTALFWRFTEGDFLAEKETQVTTIDFKIKNITLGVTPVKLYIWDTAGQEKYRSIVSTYFKGCHGVLIVFDLSR